MADSNPQLTEQQAAAISMRKLSVALSAGAGCGKTFVLTQRFLSHLQPGPDALELHQLVAITFTEKAAREMRERIRAECRRRLQSCPDQDVEHWLNIVRDLETARISTIHSFCASILRRHAVEAEIDPSFGTFEEAASGTLIRESARESLLQQLEQNNPDAVEMVGGHGLETAQDILVQLIRLRFQIDFQKWSDADASQLAAMWRSSAQRIAHESLHRLQQSAAAREVVKLLIDFPPAENKYLTPRREFLLEVLAEDFVSENPAETMLAIPKQATLHLATSAKYWQSAAIHQQVRSAFNALKEAAKLLPNITPAEDEEIEQAVRCGLVALRVAQPAIDGYEQRKREAGQLDFDDLLLRTRNLLRDFPHVRKSAAAGIGMLMVDEFQDTDRVQAEIVRLLCGDQLADGKLFLVGDAKQSIYRFRRADPKVFDELRESIDPQARLPLSVNFRSQPAILNFVNALFAAEIGETYEPLVPHADQQSPQPCIEFLWACPEEGGEEVPKENATARRQREADYVARRLCQLLGDGVPRIREKNPTTGTVELRPVKPGDIAILFRAMTDVQFYERALQKHGLSYYLVGGRAFYAQQEIYDLVNLCQYLSDPDDEISLVGLLRSPFFSLRDETLFALKQDAPTLSDALASPPLETLDEQQREQVRLAGRVLNELRRNKDRLPLHQLLNLALARTGYDAALLAEFLGRRKLANLRKLIDMARRFERPGLFTIAEFVLRLQDALAQEEQEELAATHPESSDVVRLMTIHKSKGLEFPVVVVADLDREDRSRPSNVAFDEDLGPLISVPEKFGQKIVHLGREIHQAREDLAEREESIRKFYVAATRAADHLILSSSLEEPGKTKSAWMNLLGSYFDLETGTPIVDDQTGALRILADYASSVPEIAVQTTEPKLEQIPNVQSEGLLPLKRLRDSVADAQPDPFPALLTRFEPDLAQRRQFSVSELEQIDALLQSRQAADDERMRTGSGEDDTDPHVDFEAATALGTLVHDVLEQIDFRDPRNTKVLVEHSRQALRATVSDETCSQAVEMVEEFLNSPPAEELRTARRAYRELEFLLTCGAAANNGVQRYLTGFIDIVFESPAGAWHVVDYKTGRLSHHGSEAEQRAVYELQMGTYALAVRQLLGRLPDSLELWLLAEGCRRIEFSVDETFLSGIELRLTAAISAVIAPQT